MDILNKYPPKEKKKTGRRPKYKLEFMNMVASKVVDDGMKFREAAQTFGISQGSVAVWVKTIRQVKFPLIPKNQRLIPVLRSISLKREWMNLLVKSVLFT
jgi:transposase-like protein